MNPANRDIYPFADPKQQVLFSKIIHELRCSVCQNQNLSDSMAPLAIDLRMEIYRKVQAHQSEQEIVGFVSSRYGDFVLYNPPMHWGTAFLWFGPLALLIVGLWVLKSCIK
jgi:cytochrome c-type biogenesis protein CcmH